MSRRASSIPETQGLDHPTRRVVGPVREQLMFITGVGNEIAKIADPTTATAEDCANKINEIIDRLQLKQ